MLFVHYDFLRLWAAAIGWLLCQAITKCVLGERVELCFLDYLLQAKNLDFTITLNRTDLESVMGGAATFDDLPKSGKAKFDGDRKPFDQLKGMLVQFDLIFEILPGTVTEKPVPKAAKDPFGQEMLSIQSATD